MSYESSYDAAPPASGNGPSESARYPEGDAPRGGYNSDSGRDRDMREPSRGHYDSAPKEEPRDYPPPPREERERDGRGYSSAPRGGYEGGGGGGGGGGRSSGGPRGPVARPDPSNCLGVFGLSLRTKEADLDHMFKQYGEVQSVTIVYDQKTGRSRCFGFIQMATTEQATLCIEKLNGVDLQGRNMRVDYSTTQRPHDPTPGAYMGHKRPERSDNYGGGYSGGGGYGSSRGGYSRGGYDDRRGSRYDDYDRYDSRGGRDDYDRRGGRDDRYDDYYRYDSYDRDRRDRDRYERRERSPPRRREYYDSDAQRAPRRYSDSPEPRDDRKDRDRDPRAGSRAAYEEAPPPADARY